MKVTQRFRLVQKILTLSDEGHPKISLLLRLHQRCICQVIHHWGFYAGY
jgi:hypothetical protein